MSRTAIVIGATGLVGSHLVKLLLKNNNYKSIKIFGRRTLGLKDVKIKEFITDFDDLNSIKKEISGDVLFSTMGTTIKSAGTKEAQYKVDYTYQFEFAKMAAENGVKNYILVSSAGANANSRFFYMRMKGELDQAVQSLTFENKSILRPATLAGNRTEKRAGEKFAIHVTHFMARLIPGLKKYRPIHADIVATAMINADLNKNNTKFQIYSFEEVFSLAGK
jgi:uncharacterized protein YbjT (DUF2867 family)